MMAHVTLTDGRELDVPDSDTALLDYYRGEGATINAETMLLPPYTIDEHGQVVEPPVVTEVESSDPAEVPPADDETPPAGDPVVADIVPDAPAPDATRRDRR